MLRLWKAPPVALVSTMRGHWHGSAVTFIAARADLRNRLLAFSVRLSPRSVARKIAGALNKPS